MVFISQYFYLIFFLAIIYLLLYKKPNHTGGACVNNFDYSKCPYPKSVKRSTKEYGLIIKNPTKQTITAYLVDENGKLGKPKYAFGNGGKLEIPEIFDGNIFVFTKGKDQCVCNKPTYNNGNIGGTRI